MLKGFRYCEFGSIEYALNPEEERFVAGLASRFAISDTAPRDDAIFTINGVNYYAIYRPVICEIACSLIPELVTFAGKARTGLRTMNIHTLLSVDSLSEHGRLLLAVCRQHGVRSVFVDHGIDGARPAMKSGARFPADVAVDPGTYSRKDRALSSIALGAPCLDRYAGVRSSTGGRIRNVLFLGFEDNFYERLDRFMSYEKYYEEIYLAIPRLLKLGINVFFRPNPAESKQYQLFLMDFFQAPTGKIHYLDGGWFHEVVGQMDVVVANLSTCLYQSQAAGIPTIFLDPDYIPEAFVPPFSGENFDEVIRVTSGAELAELIESQLENQDRLIRYMKGFRSAHAPKYLGPLDGRAAERVHQFLSTD